MPYLVIFVLVVCAGMFSWAFAAVSQCGEDDDTLRFRLQEEQKTDISSLLRRDGDDALEQDGNFDYMRKVASMGRRSSLAVTICWRLQRDSPERDEYLEMCAEALLLRLAFWGCVAECGVRYVRKLLSGGPILIPLFFPRIAAEICDHMERSVEGMIGSYQT